MIWSWNISLHLATCQIKKLSVIQLYAAHKSHVRRRKKNTLFETREPAGISLSYFNWLWSALTFDGSAL
jgi:hypothetical protein